MASRTKRGIREPVRFYGTSLPDDLMNATVVYTPWAVCPNCGAQVTRCNGLYQSHPCLRLVETER